MHTLSYEVRHGLRTIDKRSKLLQWLILGMKFLSGHSWTPGMHSRLATGCSFRPLVLVHFFMRTPQCKKMFMSILFIMSTLSVRESAVAAELAVEACIRQTQWKPFFHLFSICTHISFLLVVDHVVVVLVFDFF